MRLHLETPARNAFEEYLRKVRRPQGRPKTTWVQTIRHNLSKIRIKLDLSSATKTLNKLVELTQNRTDWSNIVKTHCAVIIACDVIVEVVVYRKWRLKAKHGQNRFQNPDTSYSFLSRNNGFLQFQQNRD